ncbi:MAG: YicC family protein [Spirochaetales bacterium]|jgi:uncharacterized protein (TIGR00255 family)|nr:YicC family protein [Spirochaetales bacterium]
MKSMTGFSRREERLGSRTYTVELKSYNSRYLDLFVYLPPYLSSLEPRVRAFLGRRILRGRVECSINLREENEAISVSLDKTILAAFLPILGEIKKMTGIRGGVTLDEVLKLEGILRIQRNRDAEAYWEELEGLLTQVFEVYEAEGIREAQAACRDIEESLGVIEDRQRFFRSRSGEMEGELQGTLRERFAALLADKFDENRVLTETALLLMKYSINEEIVRLGEHLAAFREGMGSPGPQGKRLEFLCQEMGREINTIGAKSFPGDVIRAVVDCKDHLERIREQLRNLE